jgi:16S rRNA (guanine966-N2)-methyltransferase
VRIIAGSWRGRRLPVADAPGLRPTTDRVRETLFNWLQDITPGARCLDLFAGSGALGLEALSRGAAQCTFVDLDARNLRQIGAVLAELGAGERGACVPGCASAFLGQPQSPYDLIFVDPPFGSGMLTQIALQLEQSGARHAQTRIYVERDRHDRDSTLPTHWQALREKCAGSVRYGLYTPTAQTES